MSLKGSANSRSKNLSSQKGGEGAVLTDMLVFPAVRKVPIPGKFFYQCTVCNHLSSDPINKYACQKCGQHSISQINSYTTRVLEHGYILEKDPCDVCNRETSDPRLKNHSWSFTCPKCQNYIIFDDLSKFIQVTGKKGRTMEEVRAYMDLHFHCKAKTEKAPIMPFRTFVDESEED